MARRNINGRSGYKTMATGVNRITQRGQAGVGAGSMGAAMRAGYIPQMALDAQRGGASGTVRLVEGGRTRVTSGNAKS